MIKIDLGIVWENTTPDTEILRFFCAGIGPLQLGVVLVYCMCREQSVVASFFMLVFLKLHSFNFPLLTGQQCEEHIKIFNSFKYFYMI